MSKARVTVTLPSEIARAVDREDASRSDFVLRAVLRELDRLRGEHLLGQSLLHPHPESLETAEIGFGNWARGLTEDALELVAPGAGRAVRWSANEGWVSTDE